ncbi:MULTISPECIES: hypothetical protein [unclassified Plantibacter]|uniref:hypothetical protein n=1 Tax=unclassified Plantibacter TaxID=2624265 RepID=UPI00188DA4B5|nr:MULTISPECIES: hypothetical protein [unclassified Plantibacter]
MTITTPQPSPRSVDGLDSGRLAIGSTHRSTLRPRFEGTNICTWIGFKHVNYLVEEAVLAHFRAADLGPGQLFEEYALGLDLVDVTTRILHALHIDDEVRGETSRLDDVDDAAAFRVVLFVERAGATLKAVTSTVHVSLRRDDRHTGVAAAAPDVLSGAVVDRIARRVSRAEPPVDRLPVPAGLPTSDGATSPTVPVELLARGGSALVWRSHIPYPYCHHTVRLQMSGHLRNLEEVVDRYLAAHGVSIRTLLDEQDWIPVVPVSRISMVAEALMEEELITVFEVVQVFKRATYTARMDSYVIRDSDLVLVATGTITHGYAVIESRSDWSMIEFDDRLLGAL